ncbi:pyrimidine 5'-nucleotidase [Pseudoduganella guangdongensis]|uniref:pyrimidine 5'-nucleotidase n=1 Tax=Pseudoduganella guangdongensis TaxID=2692179 RepID=UPI003530AE25
MNIKPLAPVWLFDLDNTLHNASHAIFPAMVEKMNAYMARVLANGEAPASPEQISAARELYWRRYGATLLGLVRHHGVDAAHFLRETHELPGLEAMIRHERGLGQLLRRLPGRKILLTNAPRDYARKVVGHMGIGRAFSDQITIESMVVHRQLRPKPSRLMLRRLMRRERLDPRRCILVEDTLDNLRSAHALGMCTVWVTQYLLKPGKRPAWLDVKVKSVKHLSKHKNYGKYTARTA